ncbi:MAG: endolytic transglycosylase MltG, partial [Pontibacterium sp.]
YSAWSELDILKRARQSLNKVLQDAWVARDESLPYDTPYEALIMASIIEKETGRAAERPVIAGVFVRRLNKKMRLQTDPTVIYGMGERYKGNITRKDLRRPTPYNTYTIPALPPTPIATVGKEAITAALNPAEGNALYFVAKGDGSHQFSATLAEHNKAVREYQLKRRKDYRSSP